MGAIKLAGESFADMNTEAIALLRVQGSSEKIGAARELIIVHVKLRAITVCRIGVGNVQAPIELEQSDIAHQIGHVALEPVVSLIKLVGIRCIRLDQKFELVQINFIRCLIE